MLKKKGVSDFCCTFETTSRKFSDLKVQSVALQWRHLGNENKSEFILHFAQFALPLPSICRNYWNYTSSGVGQNPSR